MAKRIVNLLIVWLTLRKHGTGGLSPGNAWKSSFYGTACRSRVVVISPPTSGARLGISSWTMRKQKASDRRTRRLQRGEDNSVLKPREYLGSVTSSPMQQAGLWSQKSLTPLPKQQQQQQQQQQQPSTDNNKTGSGGGRGRSRKRSNLYNTLASYHDKFFSLLTAEYRVEEEEVLGRIKASLEEPLGLESAGYALYDLYPERRGNLFSDEVYRLVKANDATTTYASSEDRSSSSKSSTTSHQFPPNHKFGSNDVILLTLQPGGSGDFFDPISSPTSDLAISVEGRVLNLGPNYLDVALPRGVFETAFGPAPNNNDGPKGDASMRLRADRFFSNIPYMRMVSAINQITSIPKRQKVVSPEQKEVAAGSPVRTTNVYNDICMDELLRDITLSSYAFNDPSSPLFRDADACNLRDLAKNIAKPPMSNSPRLAQQFISYLQSNVHGFFSPFNGPQLTAIEAALSRRLTLIQGPPGSGKTTVAAAIAYGFVSQCRTISPNAKVLACAFSNVGADNLAEGLVRLDLKVVRIGKASAVSKNLWGYTLDAAIDKDPIAQKAMRDAAEATSKLAALQRMQQQRGSRKNVRGAEGERLARDAATVAVKASIKACNIAATKALRDADVIVATSTGASDPRLLAACGLAINEEDMSEEDGRRSKSPAQRLQRGQPSKSDTTDGVTRTNAPDKRPPLSLPFVLVDEACQSVEPATLIPLTSSNSCRSLVLLGDPCQLPPTVRSTPDSPLSMSLMERLSSTIPEPVIVTGKADSTLKDDSFLTASSILKARSIVQTWGATDENSGPYISYRKRFAGSLLLSVQYRMHPSIAAFSSAIFYDGLLSTPSFLAGSRKFPTILGTFLPCEKSGSIAVRMINVGGRNNERRGASNNLATTVYGASNLLLNSAEQTTYRNEAEATRIVDIIKHVLLNQSESDDTFPKSIGVVTPYNGQVQLIKSMMASDDQLSPQLPKLSIEVNSVDGYQGRERDLIIFSAVRSNRSGKLGFLHDWRRMNVALTRARTSLIVVGDLETLVEGDKHWAAFGKWCQGVHCIIDSNEIQRVS